MPTHTLVLLFVAGAFGLAVLAMLGAAFFTVEQREESIVPGGGVALLRTLPALARLKFTGDQQYGVNIIRRAIEGPLRQISRRGA